MEHVVFYTAADGSPAYRRTANLDDAVRVVEHLRNAEGREEVHVYALNSVALNFRPYYRVELNANAAIPAQPDAASVAPAVTAPVMLPESQPVQSELAAFAAELVAEAAVPEQVQEAGPVPVQSAPQQPVAAPMLLTPEAHVEPQERPVFQEQPAYAAELAREQPLPAPPAAPQHAYAAPAPDPMGQFLPMPPVAEPMPAHEPMPAMAAAPAGEVEDNADQNGQGRGRSLGFFTR